MNAKIELGRARAVAESLVERLKPACDRIEIAGSIRRRRPWVGDIEIVFVPRFGERAKDLLETERYSLADEEINRLVSGGVLAKRPAVNGVTTWGDKNKLAVHCWTGIPVDLFAELDPAGWWRTLVIRTGPKEFNLRLIDVASRHGLKVHAYGWGSGIQDFRTNTPGEYGAQIGVSNEREFIEACGLTYAEPWERK